MSEKELAALAAPKGNRKRGSTDFDGAAKISCRASSIKAPKTCEEKPAHTSYVYVDGSGSFDC
jgi:hypothetical protein